MTIRIPTWTPANAPFQMPRGEAVEVPLRDSADRLHMYVALRLQRLQRPTHSDRVEAVYSVDARLSTRLADLAEVRALTKILTRTQWAVGRAFNDITGLPVRGFMTVPQENLRAFVAAFVRHYKVKEVLEYPRDVARPITDKDIDDLVVAITTATAT